jgi:ABC-type bacteriocin/lantibiotic exporter with double-glycine peptidase domain
MKIQSILTVIIKKMLFVLISIVGLILIGNILSLVFPLLLKIIIDDVIIKGDLNALPFLLFVFSILSLVSIIFKFISNYLTAFSIEKVSYYLKNKLYSHLQSLPYSFYQKKSMGDIMSYFTIDISEISNFYSALILRIANDLLTIGIIIVILALLHIKLAVICLSLYPLFFIVLVLSKKYIIRKSELIRSLHNDHNKKIQDDFSNIKLTKLFTTETYRASLYESLQTSLIGQRMKIYFTNGIIKNGMLVFNTISSILLFGFGSYFVHAAGGDLLTIGSLSAFYTYLFYLYQPIQSIVDTNLYYKRVKVSMGKLNELFAIKKEQENGKLTDLTSGVVRFKDICFKYDNDMVLHNVTFTINDGEKVALVGGNGMGKTTLINLIVRLYDSHKGIIFIGNNDINRYSLKCLRRNVGVLSQELYFFEDSIKNNLLMGMENVTTDDMTAAADLSGAYEFIKKLPQGFDTKIREKGANFSRGQLQKLAITRLILKDSRIIILDEPTSALDKKSVERFYDLFNTVFYDKTILYITHNRDDIKDGHRTLAFDEKKVKEVING